MSKVNWDDEKECFDSILRELAFFCSPRPFAEPPSAPDGPNESSGSGGLGGSSGPSGQIPDVSARTAEEIAHQAWQLEHVLFPSFRRYTAWPKDLLGTEIRQVANLPDLFRIFERC